MPQSWKIGSVKTLEVVVATYTNIHFGFIGKHGTW